MSEEKKLIQKFCLETWWLMLLRGIVLFVLGVLLLTKPGITLIIFVQFLAAYFLIDGIFSVFKSIKGRRYMQGWGWGIFMGVLEILFGIIVFGHPLAGMTLTVSILVYWFAIIAIIFGILGIITGIKVRKQAKGEWGMTVGGILAIIFGLILIIDPVASVVFFLTIIGVLAVIGSVVEVIISLKLRSIGKKGIDSIE